MKLHLIIPDSLNDITLEQYLKFDKINIDAKDGRDFL